MKLEFITKMDRDGQVPSGYLKSFINLTIYTLVLLISNPVFGDKNPVYEQVILFSDKEYYDDSKTLHRLKILGSKAENGLFYTVVKLTEFPTRKNKYKLFSNFGQEVKEYDFAEINSIKKSVRLGKIGFNESGDLIIPFLVDREVVVYILKNKKLVKMPLSIPYKYIENVLYESGYLYIEGQRGQVYIFDVRTGTIKEIENIRVRGIKDVKSAGGSV